MEIRSDEAAIPYEVFSTPIILKLTGVENWCKNTGVHAGKYPWNIK